MHSKNDSVNTGDTIGKPGTKQSPIQAYTNNLIADTISLRNKYFDDKNLDIKNLKIGGKDSEGNEQSYNLKRILSTLFSSEKGIQQDIAITSTPEAKDLLKKYEKNLLQMFSHLLEVAHHPSRNIAAGHDSVHTAYDGYEILNYINGVDDPAEEIATYFGSIVHDLGRTDEIEFKGGQVLDDSHSLYSLMYLFQELRNFKEIFYKEHAAISDEEKQAIENTSKALFRRVVNAVIVHPGFNDTRDPVFHHVQSLDRLAGITDGQRFFVRILLADLLHHNAPIYPDLMLDYSTILPGVFNPKGTNYNLFHKTEAYTRGTFHKNVSLSMEHGNVEMYEGTRKALVILMLLSGGYDTDLFKQTFHPELVNGSRDEFNHKKDGKKGVLPDMFKKLIQEKQLITSEEQVAMERMNVLNDCNLEDLFRIIFKQQAMYLSPQDLTKFFDYLNSPKNDALCSLELKKNLSTTLKYIIVRREMDRQYEIQLIEGNLTNNDQFKKLIAEKSMQHPLWKVSLDDILSEII